VSSDNWRTAKVSSCSHYSPGTPLTLLLQRVLGRFRLRDVDYAVHVEGHLLGVGAPVLVVEAVCVFAVLLSVECVVAGGHAAFVDLVVVMGCFDLRTSC
jgi:hypothetical protein